MRDALKNTLLALGATVSLLLLGWILVSSHALSKPDPHPFPHPVLDFLAKGPHPIVVAYRGLSSEAPANSKLAFEKAAGLGRDVVLWVDARPTQDRTWVAWSDRSLAEQTDGKTWIAYTRDADIAKLDAAYKTSFDGGKTFPFRGKGFHIETLKDILTAFPDRFFVINLQDYQEGGKEDVIKVIKDAKAGERALIASPEDGILRDLREAEPTWLFGTSRAQVTRLIMLSQLFLASGAPMRGDVFVWDPNEPAALLNRRVWQEIARRKMRSVIGADASTLSETDLRSADAIVTAFPRKYLHETAR